MWLAAGALRTWRALRGVRVVTCPETGHAATVCIDTRHAVVMAIFDRASIRLDDCSRWPTRGRCDELCLAEAQSPECTVRAIAERWYRGRACAICGKPIEAAKFLDHYAALRTPEGTTLEWRDIEPDRLPAAFPAHRPVCWNCHIAETFRREHPELVTDR